MDTNDRLDRLERALWHDRGKLAIYERTICALVAAVNAQYPGAGELLSQKPDYGNLEQAPEDIRKAFNEGVQDGLDLISAALASKPAT